MTPHDKEQIRATVRDAVKEAVAEGLPAIVEQQLPMTLGEAIGPMISDQVQKHPSVVAAKRAQRQQGTRRVLTMVGFLVMFLGLGYAVHSTRETARENRETSVRARGVVCQIITSGDSTTYAYEREGTLNHAQLMRALRQSAEYRALLGPAPACSSGLTPPPRHQPPAP